MPFQYSADVCEQIYLRLLLRVSKFSTKSKTGQIPAMQKTARNLLYAIALASSLFGLCSTVAAENPSAVERSNSNNAAEENPFLQRIVDPEGIWPKIEISLDKKTIYITGMLYEGSYFKFSDMLRANPKVSTVYLASSGGLVQQGRLIAALVRKHRLNTYVEHYCASACTQIFVSGRERWVAPNALIGFHQAFMLTRDGFVVADRDVTAGNSIDGSKVSGTTVVGVAGDAAMQLAYDRAGIAQDFVKKVFETPGTEMWHPTLDEMHAANVLTRRAEAGEVPAAPGAKSWEAVTTQLKSMPLWSAFAQRKPELFETAARDVWRGQNVGMAEDESRLLARNALVLAAFEYQKSAPDPLLERTLMFLADVARLQRAKGYTACAPRPYLSKISIDADELPLIDREDALGVELLTNPLEEPAIPAEKARKQFHGLADNIARQGRIDFNAEGVPESECKGGLQTIEAIAMLDPKRRLKAYRAMLWLPKE